MKSKYYAIRNRALANGLHWVTGQSYYIMDDNENPNIKVYTFERTEKLTKALTEMTALKNLIN